MSSSQAWFEYNGSGCVESAATSGCNFMSADLVDTGTLYQSNPVASNSNSFVKYEALKFTVGTGWNSLSAASYTIDNNAPATGLSITGAFNVTPFATPVSTASGDSGFQTTASTAAKFGGSSFTTGAANTTGPFVVTGSQTTTASGGGTVYLTAFRAQLQVTSGYTTPGNITSRTITASWTES